jgi:hypothetical protein
MRASIGEAFVFYEYKYIIRKIIIMRNGQLIHLNPDDDIYMQAMRVIELIGGIESYMKQKIKMFEREN